MLLVLTSDHVVRTRTHVPDVVRPNYSRLGSQSKSKTAPNGALTAPPRA
jgi:hypothetical protein